MVRVVRSDVGFKSSVLGFELLALSSVQRLSSEARIVWRARGVRAGSTRRASDARSAACGDG